MSEPEKVPQKPSRKVWLVAVFFFATGLIQLAQHERVGYISITPGGITPGEHYHGSLATLVILMDLILGSSLLCYCLIRSLKYRKPKK
jgi:hypothetical protein